MCSQTVLQAGKFPRRGRFLREILRGSLRLRIARTALAVTKLSRVDALRSLGFQVKVTYMQVAQAQLAQAFAEGVARTEAISLKKFQERYRVGAIDEGDLQRSDH